MFTGIIKHLSHVSQVESKTDFMRYTLAVSPKFAEGLECGASVSVDGVCQSVVDIKAGENHCLISFEAISETLKKTTLSELKPLQWVHTERSLRMGDEIGGHLLSGHIFCRVQVDAIQDHPHERRLRVKAGDACAYCFEKGYVAIDGVSLTCGQVDLEAQTFEVYCIPETLDRTHLAHKKVGDWMNLEVDPMTFATVQTVRQILQASWPK